MMLNALVDLYDVLERKGDIAPLGWNELPVSFALDLNASGELEGILDLRIPPEKGSGKPKPRTMHVPQQPTRSSGIAPFFLCDTSGYFLGFVKENEQDLEKDKANQERARRCFEQSAALHKELLGNSDAPAAQAVCSFFDSWDCVQAATSPVVSPYHDDLVAGRIVFRVNGEFAHEDKQIVDLWNARNDGSEDAVMGVCAVQGRREPIARLHGMIKGVAGAQMSGAALVSYNAPASESYGRTQSYNASIGEDASFKYVSALNLLLSNRMHVKRLGDTTMVYWAATGEEAYQTIYDGMMGGFGEDEHTVLNDELLDSIMSKIVTGKGCSLQGIDISPDMPFYVLGLSPNASRLSVRFFLESSFGKMLSNIDRHYKRLAIVRPKYDHRINLRVPDLLRETENGKAKNPKPDPLLEGALVESILNDTPYPAILYSETLQRIRAESGTITRGRAAIIKAYILKNAIGSSSKSDEYRKVCIMALQEDSTFMPYNLGRLFALYEETQEEAQRAVRGGSAPGKALRTIKDSYLVSASIRPSAIFPRILALNIQHSRILRRENVGIAINIEKKIGQVLKAIDLEHFPKLLNSYEQGAFYLGYYEQRQDRFKKHAADDEAEVSDDNRGEEN